MDQQQKRKEDKSNRNDVISSIAKDSNPAISKVGRILLVDDEQDITLVIRKGLQQFRFEVNAFNDPLEALSGFRAGSYDVALLDIRMPRMNGFELYRKLREMDDKINICFMTAFEIHEAEFKIVLPSYDVRYFICKPIKIKELAELLETLISNSA